MQQYWACSSQSKTCGPKGRPHHPEKCRQAPEKQAVRRPRLPTPSRPRKPGTRTQSTPPLHRHHTAQQKQLPADGRTLLSQAPQNKSSIQGQRQRVQQLPPFSSFPVTHFLLPLSPRQAAAPASAHRQAAYAHPPCIRAAWTTPHCRNSSARTTPHHHDQPALHPPDCHHQQLCSHCRTAAGYAARARAAAAALLLLPPSTTLGCLQEALGSCDDVVDCDAKLLVQDVGRGRGTKVVNADELALLADPALPAEAGGGLNGHAPGDGRGQHALPVGGGLSSKQLPAGH